ncbi:MULTISPECIES: CDP-diacylglycerol--serine O-phosphatidyltransferase [Paenibacillus]|uniref:CDP-diacylglycerol--serine O-phosphatidyltransferase n=1 Tax=Paenibacillus agri TaxID=2744309 RepID=A0A850EML4_9BACL|nr:CDP-diacylglycerol--serine O-phosphatidyltransferase [Paenibacillus agri]NUU59341.1 CDP-diacylglycerol--serine O-phosphatidyltransferase [Paenibacillus agri]
MKWIWLPSAFTVINLGAGALSLFFTIREEYMVAFALVMVAAVCDVLDGLLARLLHCPSDFGKQLDSLADIVSFGIAPVFLILMYKLEDSVWLGPLAAVVFLVCGALRLARFNISAPVRGFVGLPITAAGVILSLTTLLGDRVKPEMTLLVMGLLSVLMISRIPFPSFKKTYARK